MTVTDRHRTELQTLGVTKVDSVIPKTESLAARDLIRQIASEHELYTSTGWKQSQNKFGNIKPFRAAINALNHSDDFPNLIGADVIELAQTLLGEPVTPLPPGQQILFTLPSSVPWSVPHDVWHVDVPRLGDPGSPGLQMFTFLDEVQPGGGGTLVLAGSHRLMNHSGELRSKELKQQLRKERYFRSLFDPNRAPITRLEDTAGSVGDVALQVVELTGQVGDVYFMDLRTLHTPASNSSDTARMMLTCRLPRAAVASRCMGP